MFRLLAYAIVGTCLGAFAGLMVSATSNAAALGDIIAGSMAGFVIGLIVAAFVNRTGFLDGPFVTQSQMEGLSGLADWKLQQGMVPASIRDKIVSWLRSKLEGWN